MKTKKEVSAPTRREFFRLAGLGAGAAAIAGVTAGSANAATAVKPGRKDAGYQETAHVKQAYELAR